MLPTLIVEVGFAGPDTSPYLVLDDTVRGLLDTGQLAGDTVWTDVTADVLGLVARWGATRAAGPWLRPEAGTAAISLGVTDRRYDPTYLSGPYVAAGKSLVQPMRPVRVRATWADVTYPVLSMYADRWVTEYEDPQWVMVAVAATDAFKIFHAYDRPAEVAAGAGEDTGARISRILDSADWPTELRDIATGRTTVQATDLSGPALAELLTTAETELGELYVAPDGDLVFRDRHAILVDTRSTTSQGIFGDSGSELPYEQAMLESDDEIYNLARITRAGGTEQSVDDAASRAEYLTSVYTKSGLLMETDEVAAQYAGWIVHQGKDPELRFSELVIDPQTDPDNLWPHALGRQIGDRITVRRRPPGGGDPIERDAFIRGVKHEFTGEKWLTTWTLQSATRNSFFVLDSPALGTLDTNALAY